MRATVLTFRSVYLLTAAALVLVSCLPATRATAAEILASDDFEAGLERWRLEPSEQFEILTEPGTSNHVLQLTPKRGSFAHVILEGSDDYRDIRFEGRFLFPTDGDGYLGFLYNHQQTEERMDFGCLYVKSNGSYVRVSPHYDGNPSWRLHPEMQFDLEGERRIRTGAWYDFRLDVIGARASLYIDDLDEPIATYDLFPNEYGAIGLEARPRRGEPVWVDDVRVSTLAVGGSATRADAPTYETARAGLVPLSWQILGPFVPAGSESDDGSGIDVDSLDPPELPTDGWQPIEPDPRGMVLTAHTTQFRSGDHQIAFLRATFDIAEDAEEIPSWFAVATANRIDVWLNGYYRGTVAPEGFIWANYLDSAEHPGTRLPIAPRPGTSELILRVHGRRFAGGGFYAALTHSPG